MKDVKVQNTHAHTDVYTVSGQSGSGSKST